MAILNPDQKYLLFTAPGKVDVLSRNPISPDSGELFVKTNRSAISSGTEKLVYQGLFIAEEEIDSSIPALRGNFHYPFQYGYSTVGIVTDAGNSKNQNWINKRVFAFQPHSSSFISKPEDLLLIPDEIPDEDATFLPNMETAVNFLMDGGPMVGERVAVIGLGVIGLLTTSILSQFPLKLLSGIDLLPNRQITSGKIQGAVGISPKDALTTRPENGYDLIYELSGSPAGLNLALKLGGFESRIVIGSWYGKKGGEINLGGNFHRSRMKLISSQVSTISSSLTGRWTKQRRFSIAFRQLAMIKPSRWITHRYPLEQATEAYNQLISHPEETLQVLFTY